MKNGYMYILMQNYRIDVTLTLCDFWQASFVVQRSYPRITVIGTTGTIPVSQAFSLDASGSYDPDNGGPLTFSWRCQCSGKIACFDNTGVILPMPTGSIISFPAYSMSLGLYTISVTAKSQGNMVSTQATSVTIQAADAPHIQITSSNTNNYVNPSQRLILTGDITDNSSGRTITQTNCVWDCSDITVLAGSLIGTTSTVLLLAENSMNYGMQYSFTLKCSVIGGLTPDGSSTIIVKWEYFRI